MKKLKLFFALFAMLALGVTNAWGAVYFEDNFSNVGTGTGSFSSRSGWTSLTQCYPQYNTGVRIGSSKNAGAITKTAITEISGTKDLKVTIYTAKYNNDGNSFTITTTNGTITSATGVGTLSNGTLTVKPTGNAGVTSTTSPAKWTDTYKTEFIITGASKSTTITFATNKRAILGPVTIEDATTSGGSDPEPVIVKTLKSIEVTDMTTNFEIGETFTFDGTCTATYSVTKDDVALADETVEVTPTSVSAPDMTTAGTKEVIVSYTEGEITKTATYNITVENTLPKIVITQNEVAEFTNKYAEYTWTASGISGKIFAYKNSGMQINSKQDGSYVYNTDPIPGYIRKIKIVKAASGTTRNWTPSISETVLTSVGGTTLDQKEVASTTTWEVTGENSYFYLLESGGATVIESITIYYEAVVPQVAAPTFDPIEGTYNSVQNVTISAEEGATVHYTLDGQNPTTESPVYSTPIEIAETKTLKAIAVKDEKVSPIASATYTIKLPLTTMDQIFAKATAVGSTATSVEITFGNWVVSAVKEDGKTAFVTDGTKGFVIYEAGCGFKVGDVLSGTAACKVLSYNGFAELTGLTSSTTGLSITTGGAITTQELDATAIEALTGVNTGSLIKINGICSSTDLEYYVAGVQIYTSLYDFETLKVGAEYNITGVYQQFHSTKEMLPRSAEDIEEVVGLPTATIEVSNITMEVGQEKAIEATITPDAAQSTVQYAITSGNEYITLEGTTITAVAAGTATITATIAEKADEYKGATKEFTVTVKPQNIAELPFTFNGGKADIENTLGMSQTGLETDYGSAPKLKFNGVGDNVIIHFDSQAGEFSFVLKQNGQNAGTFTVYESANGEDYSSVWAGGDFGNAQSETIKPTLSESARYVKFEYTTKGASTNYGLGSISIQKADHRAEAGIAWNPATISLTVGDAFTAPTFNNPNGLSGITFASSNEALATVNNAGVITLVSGKTGTATITATFTDGHADYKPAKATCVITVSPKSEKVVILAQYNGQWYALKAAYLSGKTDRLDAIQVNYVGGKLYNVAEADKASIEWNSIVEGDKVSFLNDGKYLKGKSSTTLLFEEDADGLYQWDNTTYTMTIGTTERSFLYNGEAFRNFAVSNAGKVVNDVLYSSLPVVTAPVYTTGTLYTIKATAEKGTVTGAGVYVAGDKVTLTADPAMDYTFVNWTKGGEVVSTANPFVFEATEDLELVANFAEISQTSNTLSGTFSVGEYEVAQFATGNLQYNVKNKEWSFAKQQYQYIGDANINVGDPTFTGTIDMFGWSTSETNYGVDPRNENVYYDGEFVDWGNLFPVEDNWSTLSADQWKYLLNKRTNASSLKQIARVGSVVGIMLFPDNWNAPLTVTAQHDSYFDVDIHNYTLDQWAALENAGALFLPAAGRRTGGYGNMINYDQQVETNPENLNGGHYKHYDNGNIYCYYWTSTINESTKDVSYLHNIQALGGDKYTIGTGAVWGEKGRYGQSVRLAKVTDIIRKELTVGQLGTVCLPYNIPSGQVYGATFYTLAGMDANGRVAFDEVTGELAAGVPYLFQASAEEISCFPGTTTVTDPINSGAMKGTFVNLELDGSDLTNIYYFAKNALWSCVDLTKLSVPANRAYVNMAEVTAITGAAPVGVRRITLGVNGQNTATGVDQVQCDEVPTKMIINGQLFILRGEKMYDAQGKLVK